ncbi:Transcription elongation factor, GreA/GreB, C-term [Mucilaginibacter pineti]|uniref:Transcription elongation factor, GreA/GreB, C-term n=1 Tax=Mucilaginibacter pineti TaxID=1391627 RepID=A0A1G6XBK2_9SPHI|nr:GreA/GreB family elongation factor [Mucilaginibacter pineti]SDD75442.1 Transcription elongation factor, GreA/GreB, C-term [Mucilaginibacter pineti]
MKKFFQLTLTINDFKLLMKYYFTLGISAFNKRKLFNELNSARIVSKDNLPLNVACAGSKVLVRNIDKMQTYSVHIVVNNPDKAKMNRISLSDPLAIALLGYSDGDQTEWEMRDGINRIELVSVHQSKDESWLPLTEDHNNSMSNAV